MGALSDLEWKVPKVESEKTGIDHESKKPEKHEKNKFVNRDSFFLNRQLGLLTLGILDTLAHFRHSVFRGFFLSCFRDRLLR
jgi:hypothetical protein